MSTLLHLWYPSRSKIIYYTSTSRHLNPPSDTLTPDYPGTLAPLLLAQVRQLVPLINTLWEQVLFTTHCKHRRVPRRRLLYHMSNGYFINIPVKMLCNRYKKISFVCHCADVKMKLQKGCECCGGITAAFCVTLTNMWKILFTTKGSSKNTDSPLSRLETVLGW